MKNLSILLFTGILLVRTAGGDQGPKAPLPMNWAIAQTARNISISIVKTTWAMDGGSILNDIHFSDGRIYRLSLDYPVELMSDKLVHKRIHFTVYDTKEGRTSPEPLNHNSEAERRLIELLEKRVSITSDPHEKKNATSLISFLKERDQPFPEAHGGKWDLTRPTIKYGPVD